MAERCPLIKVQGKLFLSRQKQVRARTPRAIFHFGTADVTAVIPTAKLAERFAR